jgi:TM2 domain-containing membrane protein YozV
MNDRAEVVRSQLMYDANRKSTGVAYLLLIFLGGFGAHRFYLGRTGTAVAQLALNIAGWVFMVVGVGLLFLAILGVWLVVDLFLVPSIIRQHNVNLANDLTGGVTISI